MAKNNNNKDIGALGEGIAVRFLEKSGYKVLVRNLRNIRGEIDVLCEKDDILHFVEIKAVTRENDDFNTISQKDNYNPEEHVHPAKLKRMVKAAETYMMNSGSEKEYQIDVIGIKLDVAKKTAVCRFFEQVL